VTSQSAPAPLSSATTAPRCAPLHPIFGPLRFIFCSAVMLWPQRYYSGEVENGFWLHDLGDLMGHPLIISLHYLVKLQVLIAHMLSLSCQERVTPKFIPPQLWPEHDSRAENEAERVENRVEWSIYIYICS